jgi:hypothetical protein
MNYLGLILGPLFEKLLLVVLLVSEKHLIVGLLLQVVLLKLALVLWRLLDSFGLDIFLYLLEI